MACVLVTYIDNDLSRYDGKDYLEKTTKLRRDNEAEGELRVGERVTIKTKSRLWKAIVKDPHPPEHQGRGKKRKRDDSGSFKSPEVPVQTCRGNNDMFLGSFVPANEPLNVALENAVRIVAGSNNNIQEAEQDQLSAELFDPPTTEETPINCQQELPPLDANITAFLNCCDQQFIGKDDFDAFKTEVRQQLENITRLLQTLINQGEQLRMSPPMPTPQYEECNEFATQPLQDIGVETALMTPVRQVPFRPVENTMALSSSTPVAPVMNMQVPATVLSPIQPVEHVQVSINHRQAIEEVLNNPKITSAVQLGSELVKKLFTEDEMTTSTLTGRKVNGRIMKQLDTVRMQYIESVMKQRYPMPEGEFAATKTLLREYIASRCKYLHARWLKTNAENVY